MFGGAEKPKEPEKKELDATEKAAEAFLKQLQKKNITGSSVLETSGERTENEFGAVKKETRSYVSGAKKSA